MLETLQHFDQQIFLFFNGLHSPYWDRFMWVFTAKLTWVPMYASILYVICKNLRPSVSLLTVIAIVLTIVYADQICATLIRPLAERMRPSNPNNPISEWVHIVNGKRGGRYGFPSCHAANSFGLAFFGILLFKSKLLSLFILLWATVNSYSRIYIGVHYPGDLFVGMLVGLSGAILFYSLYRYILQTPKLSTFLKPTPMDISYIRHQTSMKDTSAIVLTGITTIILFAIYSLFCPLFTR